MLYAVKDLVNNHVDITRSFALFRMTERWVISILRLFFLCSTSVLLRDNNGYRNFILSSGYDTPPSVSFENIKMFYKAFVVEKVMYISLILNTFIGGIIEWQTD